MRPRGVVVVGPRTKDLPGVIETEEQAFVQQLVPHPAVKTFAEPVLHRLARGNVVPGDAMLGTPGKDGVRRQLGAVVRHDHARLAAPFDQSGQFPSNPFAGDRRVGDRRQAFPRHIIDDIEDPKAPAAGKLWAMGFASLQREDQGHAGRLHVRRRARNGCLVFIHGRYAAGWPTRSAVLLLSQARSMTHPVATLRLHCPQPPAHQSCHRG